MKTSSLYPFLLTCLLLVAKNGKLSAQLDTAYNPVLGSVQNPTQNPPVRTISVGRDGKAIVSGAFATVNSAALQYTISLNLDGTSDGSLSSPHDFQITPNQGNMSGLRSFSRGLDGTSSVAGYYFIYEGVPANSAVRLGVNLRRDNSFLSPRLLTLEANAVPEAFCRQLVDGTILLWGMYEFVASVPRQGLAKLGNTGILDFGFQTLTDNPGSTSFDYMVKSAVQQLDGKIVLGGRFTTVGGQSRTRVARVLSTGALDSSFANPQINNDVNCVSVQADGKVLIGGQFSTVASMAMNGVARLNADGSLDSSFSSPFAAGVAINSIALRSDGKLAVTGTPNIVALLEADGTVNAHLQTVSLSVPSGQSGSPHGNALAYQPDGRLLLGGYFGDVNGTARTGLARFEADTPASQSVAMPSPEGTSIQWLRSGSVPEVDNAQFELSTNGGTTFTKLAGTLARIAGGWELALPAGRPLPGGVNFTVRARGQATCGFNNASTSLMESSASFIRPRPVITAQPTAATTVVLGAVPVTTLSVTATSAAAVTYQWQRNGVNLAGANSASYNLPSPITTAAAGTYRVIITSNAGSTTSTNAVVTVIVPITITRQPANVTVGEGRSFTLSVVATGTAPIYQWLKNGVPIPGVAAQRASYTKPAAVPGDEDTYTCEVSNFAGPVTSATATVTVINHPTTAPSPTSAILAVGTASFTINGNVVSEGTPVMSWLKDTRPLAGQTAGSLTLSSIALGQAGKYQVRVANAASTVTSLVVEVAVVDQTNNSTRVQGTGTTVTLTAPAAGNGLTYLWKVGGTPVTLTSPRVTTSLGGKVLTIRSATPADAGNYTVDVTNTAGTLTSATTQVILTTQKPEIDSGTLNLPDAMVGEPYNNGTGYLVPQLDDLVPANDDNQKRASSFVMSGHPAGLRIDASGRITGIPTVAVLVPTTFTIKLTPVNAQGSGTPVTDSITLHPIPTNMVGSWAGLIARNAGLADNHGGRLTLTVTAAGSYSGSLTLGTLVYPFAGGDLQVGQAFNNQNSIVVARKGLPSLTLLLDINATTNLLTGSISDGTSTTALEGWRNVWKKPANPATSYVGRYNVAYYAPALPVVGVYDQPLGTSFSQLSVTDTGAVTGTLRMADGITGVTTLSGFVGPGGEFVLYQGFTTISSVAGKLVITPVGASPAYPDSTVTSTAGVTWLRRLQTATTVRSYRPGFGPITLTVDGQKYLPPVTADTKNLFGVTPVVGVNNMSITFTDAPDVTTAVDTSFQISAVNRVTMQTLASGNNPASVSVAVTPSTGLITGTFRQPILPARSATFSGVILRTGTAQGEAVGYFNLARNPSAGPPVTTTSTSPIVSGKISIVGPP